MTFPLAEELDGLLLPVPGDDPAGQPPPFELREKLDECRKEINPDDYPPDFPGRPELKRADWDGIIRQVTEALRGSSKDLMLAARLTEALTRKHGFGGCCVGLRLLRRLIEECWDRLQPPIEDGDLEPRAAAFNWLDDPARGGRFPTTLRYVPVLCVGENTVHTLDWEKMRNGSGRVAPADFEMAVLATPYDFCRTAFDELNAACVELEPLVRALEARMGSASPGMLELRKALESCRLLVTQILERKGPPPVTANVQETAAPPSNGPPTAVTVAVTPSGQRSREEIYGQIAAAAAELQRMEPHSPLPMLIRTAVDMAALPFPQLMGALARDRLMAALIRDPAILQELVREFSTIPPPQG
jgi:type VI secretion system protein ImpA